MRAVPAVGAVNVLPTAGTNSTVTLKPLVGAAMTASAAGVISTARGAAMARMVTVSGGVSAPVAHVPATAIVRLPACSASNAAPPNPPNRYVVVVLATSVAVVAAIAAPLPCCSVTMRASGAASVALAAGTNVTSTVKPDVGAVITEPAAGVTTTARGVATAPSVKAPRVAAAALLSPLSDHVARSTPIAPGEKSLRSAPVNVNR